MMRIRKKFTLLLVAVFITVILFVYIAVSNNIPDEKKNISYLETKLKQLEDGLNYHQKEVGEIKKKINGMQQTNIEQIAEPLQQPKPQLDSRDLFKDSVINFDSTFNRNLDDQKCSLRSNVVPHPDVQMLDIYRKIPFDNPDGGVWKQGWSIQYDSHEWNDHHKLKVFVVPHSHNDPGWLNTFDEYYTRQTKQILNNMLRHLDLNEKMTFIWAEISYFSRWYDALSATDRKTVKRILKRKQLEFVTGGWVMPDEANSHWLCILQQLTEGQTWLKTTLNITPTSSWSIDPFGQSPTMPFILKGSGFDNLLIQRTHYSVKKRLAQEKELEFRWRQLWDTSGETDLFTHMMPFYSYDVPHTCGPDPKICCQFDFKRLPGYGLNCPWRLAPQPIDDSNVAKKAELILDQWRKKSVLYRTRSVLIPLGDDFRYSQSVEWAAQMTNYEKLFDYINNEPSLNAVAKFSTLSEYFESVHKDKELQDFPSLSGDFFTYADRDDHYWSGYYTSRPYHKRMDRVLMNFLRSAEMIHAWTTWEKEAGFDKLLEKARRELSLFQHHDGITGTAKDHVVKDYAERMISALKNCKFVIQQAAYKLLTQPTIYQPDYKFTYFDIDDSRYPAPDETRPVIVLGPGNPNESSKHIVIHNSLPQIREEIVEFYVSTPFVTISQFDQKIIECQVAPVWSWHNNMFHSISPQLSTTKYRVMFKARVMPLGLAVYTIHAKNNLKESTGTTYSKITILSATPFSVSQGEYPLQIDFVEPRDVTIKENHNIGVSFNKYGLIKSIQNDEVSGTFPIHLEFLKYGIRKTGETSGAYLFLPDGPATPLKLGSSTVLLSKGSLESSVSAGLPFALHETIIRGGNSIEIRNLIDIGDMDNTEIVMRLSTGIKNEDVFYTDLNGFQIIKRERFAKLPIQANYYPVPSAIFIQDDSTRLTLLSGQPLGGSSLQSGQFEIMQDRRLMNDDNRGLGQGVSDNQPTLNIFKLILENRESCIKLEQSYPAGYLTAESHLEMQTLLHPFDKLIYHGNDWEGVIDEYGVNHEAFANDIEVAVLRNLPHITLNDKSTVGIVLYRRNFEECSTNLNRDGNINLRKNLGLKENKDIYSTAFTLLKKGKLLSTDELNICPMDVKAFIIER